jgi:hypothetical protein
VNSHERFLSERDKLVFEKSGHGNRVGFGERPVIIVIDVNYAFCGEESLPILESIETYHNSCGEGAWAGYRGHRAPDRRGPRETDPRHLHDRIRPSHRRDVRARPLERQGSGRRRRYRSARQRDRGAEIAPQPHDIVLEKTMPSAFFATNLASYLVNLRADTVLVCGTTTSGCVRASVVDGFSNGYRMIVVEEGTFDRGQASHAINLFDMDMKYADVTPPTTC